MTYLHGSHWTSYLGQLAIPNNLFTFCIKSSVEKEVKTDNKEVLWTQFHSSGVSNVAT